MQVYDYVSGAVARGGTTASMATGGAREDQVLGRDAFLKLLVAQLKNQDPLNPVDNQQFVAQLAQLQSLEELRSLGESLNVMANLLLAGQAGGLLGRRVKALTPQGEVEGRVESLRLESGRILLATDAGEVDLRDVVEVHA
ncbi:MAG: flagellar hook capping FlgD N-terminal domain-containing protein [Actinomycetota bacterium]|jgi:flagellar basal-body rod modification protein FlgD|nr:flagellar hook capping FlgD N-terminal domain-containing protein [Actinomycetota bacterium]MDI7252089.1 flagellar hook capping FlgD N-terminal domain-containing protein [Actinomycetota bacterium]